MPAVPAPPAIDKSIEQWFLYLLVIALVSLAIYTVNLQKQINNNFQSQIEAQKRCAEEIKNQVDEKADSFTKVLEKRERDCANEREKDNEKSEKIIAELKEQNQILKLQLQSGKNR